MNTFKICIELLGRLQTPLCGDTIWGHIAWDIALREGEEAINEFLLSYEDTMPLCISNAFPHNLLPVPILKTLYTIDDKNRFSAKQIKKMCYVSASFLLSGKTITWQSLIDDWQNHLNYKDFVEVEQVHNVIHRESGTTIEGGLFSVNSKFAGVSQEKNYNQFDIYAVTSFSKERLDQLFKNAFSNGYGADANTGAGNIVVKSVEEVQFPSSGNRSMALAPFVPNVKDSMNELLTNIFVRHGKLGPVFSETMNPFKKTIIMYDAGTSFSFIDNAYTGCLLSNVHTDERIKHHAFTPLIHFNEGC